MALEERTAPLLWTPETGKGATPMQSGGHFAGELPRWQSGGGQDPLPGDVPSDEHFTDIPPALPLRKPKEAANIVGAIFYLILLAVCAAAVTVSALLVPRSYNYVTMSITCSCNVALLGITGLLQKHLAAEQRKEKRQGYIKFCNELDWIIHLPFDVLATGTALSLIAVVWQPANRNMEGLSLLAVRFIVLLEIAVTTFAIGAYLHKVCKHHSVDTEPDVMSALYSELAPPAPLDGVRYQDGGLTEQQAVLLQYQEENMQYLNKEILRLQETLSKIDSSQTGILSQDDVLHLLAAREQECRAVTAERDQLLSELSLARELTAERDNDVKKVEENNHQYMEEIDRVRAMLVEWSTRTAKLELALEAERLSSAELQKRIAMSRQHSSTSK